MVLGSFAQRIERRRISASAYIDPRFERWAKIWSLRQQADEATLPRLGYYWRKGWWRQGSLVGFDHVKCQAVLHVDQGWYGLARSNHKTTRQPREWSHVWLRRSGEKHHQRNRGNLDDHKPNIGGREPLIKKWEDAVCDADANWRDWAASTDQGTEDCDFRKTANHQWNGLQL